MNASFECSSIQINAMNGFCLGFVGVDSRFGFDEWLSLRKTNPELSRYELFVLIPRTNNPHHVAGGCYFRLQRTETRAVFSGNSILGDDVGIMPSTLRSLHSHRADESCNNNRLIY